jgi:hypothetical protein
MYRQITAAIPSRRRCCLCPVARTVYQRAMVAAGRPRAPVPRHFFQAKKNGAPTKRTVKP